MWLNRIDMSDIESDLDLYGIAYEYQNENGDIIRLDPTKVKCKQVNIKSDFERFKDLYDRLGIKYLAGAIDDMAKCFNKVDNEYYHMLIGDLSYYMDDIDQYYCNGDKIDGYGGFHTRILFDKDGKFIKQGFWE